MPADEIRDAFHTAFERVVGGVTADPALLATVRRRHARQRRLLTVLVPLGGAAATAGAAVGATIYLGDAQPVTGTTPESSEATSSESTQAPPDETAPLQAVSVLGHDLSLPSDWKLSGNRKLIDLDTMQPAQPVGGKDQSVTATSPDGAEQFEATIYSGPIADAERAGGNSAEHDATFTHLVINGLEASIKVSGPATTCITVRVPKDGHLASGPAEQPTPVKGPCPTSPADDPPYGEARYTFANGDFMMVDTKGMSAAVVTDFLRTALSS
jgi:hypothetical protein